MFGEDSDARNVRIVSRGTQHFVAEPLAVHGLHSIHRLGDKVVLHDSSGGFPSSKWRSDTPILNPA